MDDVVDPIVRKAVRVTSTDSDSAPYTAIKKVGIRQLSDPWLDIYRGTLERIQLLKLRTTN